jgi:hypothetical protein
MQEHQAELQRFKRDIDYYEAHREELLKRYPEQWVAIFNEQVAASDADFDHLLSTLDQQGVPSERALIEHVTEEDELLILRS